MLTVISTEPADRPIDALFPAAIDLDPAPEESGPWATSDPLQDLPDSTRGRGADSIPNRRGCRAGSDDDPAAGASSSLGTDPAAGDDTLVGRLRAGDMEALGEIFARHHRCALATARRLIDPTTADDMVSEAVERLAAAIRRGHGPTSHVCSYLRRAVRTCVIDYLRKRREVPERQPEAHAVVSDSADRSVDRILCREALAQLPARWRFALWMTYAVGLGRAELGDSLGLGPQAATQLLRRARIGLRAIVTEQGSGDTSLR